MMKAKKEKSAPGNITLKGQVPRKLPPIITGAWNFIMSDCPGITNESYCLIIGSSSVAKKTKGSDMLWHLDYNEPILQLYPAIVPILKLYESMRAHETTETRKLLFETMKLYINVR